MHPPSTRAASARRLRASTPSGWRGRGGQKSDVRARPTTVTNVRTRNGSARDRTYARSKDDAAAPIQVSRSSSWPGRWGNGPGRGVAPHFPVSTRPYRRRRPRPPGPWGGAGSGHWGLSRADATVRGGSRSRQPTGAGNGEGVAGARCASFVGELPAVVALVLLGAVVRARRVTRVRLRDTRTGTGVRRQHQGDDNNAAAAAPLRAARSTREHPTVLLRKSCLPLDRWGNGGAAPRRPGQREPTTRRPSLQERAYAIRNTRATRSSGPDAGPELSRNVR
jgi:hypothetical protein